MPRARKLPADLETDPKKVLELLVGLPEVSVGCAHVWGPVVELHVEKVAEPVGCPTCGVVAQFKGWRGAPLSSSTCPRSARNAVALAQAALALRRLGLRHGQLDRAGPADRGSTDGDDRPCRTVGDRSGGTLREGASPRWPRSSGVTGTPSTTPCSATARPSSRILVASTSAHGLDEVLFVRRGPMHTKEFATSIADVRAGQLLDVVPGRSAQGSSQWLYDQGLDFCAGIEWATLDLSGPYRSVFDAMVPGATQVADPFHVVKHANTKLDEARRRVQNETLGHRGRKADPLYRIRRLLTKAEERLEDSGREKLVGLLRAGDPRGEVATTMPRRPSGSSMHTATRPPHASGSSASSSTWPIVTTPSRCVPSDAPWPAGATRSLPGTAPMSRTARPRQPTT